MATINQNMLSEINNFPNTSEKMKDFLRWLIEYERSHSDRKLIFYKSDLEKYLDELLSDSKEEKI